MSVGHENTLGLTTILQTEEWMSIVPKFKAIYRIENEFFFEHTLSSIEIEFIYCTRMKYCADLSHFRDTVQLYGDDCLKWCRQANRLCGVGEKCTYISDIAYKHIVDNISNISVTIIPLPK